jgi:hypothetical protein
VIALTDTPESSTEELLNTSGIAVESWGTCVQRRSLNCSLNHVICSLNHVNCSLNHVICSLNHVNCSLYHVNCSLNHVNCSLNHSVGYLCSAQKPQLLCFVLFDFVYWIVLNWIELNWIESNLSLVDFIFSKLLFLLFRLFGESLISTAGVVSALK